MITVVLNRRNLLAAGGSILATGVSGLLLPARAQGLSPTDSMAGGANNYRKGAPIVDRIGKGGFWMSGTVRRAGDGAPLAGQRIQIWAHTTEGQEHEPQSHGATLTDKNGAFTFVGLPAGETYQVAGKGAGYRTTKKVTMDPSSVTSVPVVRQ